MATHTTNITAHGFNLSGRISSFLSKLGAAMDAHARNHARIAQIERLQAKTDAELLEMGLKRDDIMRHVYRDLFYI